jgi:hypothetical protein
MYGSGGGEMNENYAKHEGPSYTYIALSKAAKVSISTYTDFICPVVSVHRPPITLQWDDKSPYTTCSHHVEH